MHTVSPMKHGMHLLHEGGSKAMHAAAYLLHDKRFWGVLAILTVLAALFALAVLFGSRMPPSEYGMPVPYGYI